MKGQWLCACVTTKNYYEGHPQHESGHPVFYHVWGEFLDLTSSLGNWTYFLSPQTNSSCISLYCLLLAKLCWLWHSIYFLSLREISSNNSLLIRMSILCGQHLISYIPRWEKDTERWAKSQESWFCSLFGFSSLSGPSPSLCSDFLICNRRDWTWWAVGSMFLCCVSRIRFSCFLTDLAKYYVYFSEVCRAVWGCGLVHPLSFNTRNNSQCCSSTHCIKPFLQWVQHSFIHFKNILRKSAVSQRLCWMGVQHRLCFCSQGLLWEEEDRHPPTVAVVV